MAGIRKVDTRPELLLRCELWRLGVRGWRTNWKGPGGRIDVAFTRWHIAVFVDGAFWHGHPTKWQPDRWVGYWDEKIKRNIARDARQNEELRVSGWTVLRFWDFDVEHDPTAVAQAVLDALEAARAPLSLPEG